MPDGSLQSFYYPDDHELSGYFKGMAVILEERGFGSMQKVRAMCRGFHCPADDPGCCCRRILYNQPDFAGQLSELETKCRERNIPVLFLPKFHCELNFIEQCWGYAKRLYRLCPPSTREEDLERNVVTAVDAVPLDMMRR